jgi:thiosulfate/3-mercaptopyruvate sulfurtransferase
MAPRAVLITTAQLQRISDPAIILDASWVYPPFNHADIDVRNRYAEAHIPGSWFLDLEALSDPARRCDPRVEVIASPRREILHAVVTQTGASSNSLIVITDMDGGCTTAPFARHALMDAGYADVRLLDGGTPAWRAESGTTDAEPRYLDIAKRPEPLPARGETGPVFVCYEDVVGVLDNPAVAQVVDCRAEPSNEGVLPADYAGLVVPADAHVSSSEIVEPIGVGLRFKRKHELVRIFGDAGVDAGRLKVTMCYFGLGASVVATALEIAGYGPVRVYPGSLLEYAVRQRLVRLS